MPSLVLWIAQGFGIGRMPVAPGTFGSIAGLFWFGAWLHVGHLGLFFAGLAGSALLAVWLGGASEKILQQTDPPSVVLDEIIAVPFCFAALVVRGYLREGHLPEPSYFLEPGIWPFTLGIFGLFRFFDIVKPWPVRQSQSLPGGWGVTVDDLLAAVYVNLSVLGLFLIVPARH